MSGDGYSIRRADEQLDWRALRMLLPRAIHHGCGCDALVATVEELRCFAA